MSESMQSTQKSALRIMEAVEPDKVHNIVLAIFSGCMTCLVTLKDQQLSILTQGMDVGKQIAHSVKAYTEPLII